MSKINVRPFWVQMLQIDLIQPDCFLECKSQDWEELDLKALMLLAPTICQLYTEMPRNIFEYLPWLRAAGVWEGGQGGPGWSWEGREEVIGIASVYSAQPWDN